MHLRRTIAAALLPVLVAACSSEGLLEDVRSAVVAEKLPADEEADALETVPYTVTLDGVSGGVEDAVKQASRLVTFEDRPPGSLDALRRRIARDRTLIDEALRSQGYYRGSVRIDLDDTVRPMRIAVAVEPGPLFHLARFAVQPSPGIPLRELGLAIGQPARAKDILAAQDALLTALARRAHPLARILDDKVVVDHATNSLAVDLSIDPGPAAAFGPVRVEGLTGVEENFVRKRLPWRQGEPFDLTRLEQARERLVKSNLFSSIRLTPGEALTPEGTLPVTVALKERDHRTIGGTLSWSTDEGPGVEAYWEHRNLLSAGEKLRLRGYYNGLGYGAEAGFRNPDQFGVDWDLISSLELKQETTEAYDSASATASIGADLQITREWKLTTSVAVEYLREEEDDEISHFTLASLPNKAVRDTRDDRLDPTRGSLLTAQVEPYYDMTGDAGPFLRLQLSERVYYQMSQDPRVVLAGWADVGAIAGRDRDDLPARKRLYAGGGGSVRAFGYQMAGPVDEDGEPLGGRSLLAFGGEARVKVTDTIGIVPFIEAGTVYDTMLPNFSEPLFWGAGLGVRYHTPIGPIRADIAFPLNGREGIDDAFQIYLSFGQAF